MLSRNGASLDSHTSLCWAASGMAGGGWGGRLEGEDHRARFLLQKYPWHVLSLLRGSLYIRLSTSPPFKAALPIFQTGKMRPGDWPPKQVSEATPNCP